MKKWICCSIVFAYAIQTHAIDCKNFGERIHKLEDLRRHGGSLKQMERWRVQSDELSAKLSQCNREESIQVVSGAAQTKNIGKPRGANLRFRKANSSDPQTQQLLATCNYWISEYNNHSSATNGSFKDTACRALDDKLASREFSPPAESTAIRSLSECIKPNNLIDKDVEECRQGRRDPLWKKKQ